MFLGLTEPGNMMDQNQQPVKAQNLPQIMGHQRNAHLQLSVAPCGLSAIVDSVRSTYVLKILSDRP